MSTARNGTAGAAVVTADSLTKVFGTIHAVEDLDLEIRRGEVFGYLGPNGSGKTTTIRLLLDFLRPTRGTCTVLGGSGADPEVRRRIGYLPGDLRIDPSYTANDVVDFFSSLRGTSDRAWAAQLVERFDLDPTRPISQLSTGNRRKVGLVQAFMSRPELLLLDEPTSGLDPLLQNEFNRLVREVTGDGATVLLSSHVLPEVEALADRVAILRRGRLVAVQQIGELRRQARQRLDLYVSGPADDTPFRGLPGVLESIAADGMVRLVVEGSVDAVVKAAATLHVERIVTHEADLEDVFLGYYEGRAQ